MWKLSSQGVNWQLPTSCLPAPNPSFSALLCDTGVGPCKLVSFASLADHWASQIEGPEAALESTVSDKTLHFCVWFSISIHHRSPAAPAKEFHLCFRSHYQPCCHFGAAPVGCFHGNPAISSGNCLPTLWPVASDKFRHHWQADGACGHHAFSREA